MLRAVRGQPALHHGPGRHGFLRPCRLFRPRRLWRRRCCAEARRLPMEAALVLAPLAAGTVAVVFGWFCVRLTGVYLAMLTLAFAQITWSVVFQWDASPAAATAWSASGRRLAGRQDALYYLADAVAVRLGVALLWRIALLAVRLCAARRPRFAAARGRHRHRRAAPASGRPSSSPASSPGWPARLYAFSKGSISPAIELPMPRSVDGLVMVLLGGIQTLTGPVVGAAVFTWLRDDAGARAPSSGAPCIGVVILLIVLALSARAGRRPRSRSAAEMRAGRAGMSVVFAGRGLHKSFGGVQAVADVSFAIEGGETAGADRSQRRRQDHLLQHAQRPAPARCRRSCACKAATSSA